MGARRNAARKSGCAASAASAAAPSIRPFDASLSFAHPNYAFKDLQMRNSDERMHETRNLDESMRRDA